MDLLNNILQYFNNIIDFFYVFAFMTSLFIIDKFIRQDNIRWFVLHSITNFLVIIFCFYDMFSILKDPLYVTYDASIYPRIFTIGLHTYHLVAFKKIEFIDYIHHFLMIGALLSTYYFTDMNITNYFLFYMTGLTGFVDYIMLTLIKKGYLHKITEKKVNSNLNNYIRYPFIMNGITILYFRYLNNIYTADFLSIFALMLIFFWNGSYFNYRVIYNYGQNDIKREEYMV